MSVGVVVGRFQVAAPTPGHLSLIEQVRKRHQKVLICLGVSPTRLSATDPLDYAARERMMRAHFPFAVITPLYDGGTDEGWSKQLDTTVAKLFPTDVAVLYGSRSSFFPRYHGGLSMKELDEVELVSGTKLRQTLRDDIRDSEDWRAGIVYACANRHPISYQTVDVAILRATTSTVTTIEVLLCGKADDPDARRFVGGFVAPTDASLEDAAKREVGEETGVEIDQLHYFCSARVLDWRYRGREDQILTAFFLARYVFGMARPSDDIVTVEWVPIQHVADRISPDHQALAAKLLQYKETTR